MRLVMTADAVGGVWTYALDLARGLRAHGVETTLLVNGPSPAQPPAEVEVIATGLPLDWLATSPEEVTGAGRRLAELAGDLRADLVQLNSPAYGADARLPAPVVGVQHSCTATWWRAVRGAAPWPADFAWRFDLARRGLLACDAVVAPTHAFAAAMQAEYALSIPPLAVWNGRDPTAPDRLPPASRAECVADPRSRSADRASGPACRIGSAVQEDMEDDAPPPGAAAGVFIAGRLWDESKGAAVLDAAADGLEAPVAAAGPLAAPGGAPVSFANLRTLGVLMPTELRARMAAAAVFVAPSLYEPFGLAVLEAAQAARPLVLSDIPTFRELWDGAAVFTPPRDAPALRSALRGLLDDAPLRRALGRAAAARAQRYTVEAMAHGMMDVYARLQLRRS